MMLPRMSGLEVFQRILVPTDFSDASNRALDVALELARKFNSEVVVAHFWGVPAYPYLAEGYPATDLTASLQRAADAHMAQTIARVQRALPGAQCRPPSKLRRSSISRLGMPWEEILKTIESERIDAVVMGTHARHGINRLLLGSVAEKVVRSSPVPVLTVPPGADDKPRAAAT